MMWTIIGSHIVEIRDKRAPLITWDTWADAHRELMERAADDVQIARSHLLDAIRMRDPSLDK